MKLKPKFIQRNCSERQEIDIRGALAVKKYKPDIVIEELPMKGKTPDTIFNKYPANKKPLKEFEKMIHRKIISGIKNRDALSDVLLFQYIKDLWNEGKNTLIFYTDMQNSFRGTYKKYMKSSDDNEIWNDWLFWVYLFIRDCYMAKNVKWVLDNYKAKSNPTILIMIQSFHWRDIKFLFKNPSKQQIWKHYFGRLPDGDKKLFPHFFKNFPGVTPETIDGEIKKRSKIIYKYWKLFRNKII
jgi:hypothetical protein